MKTKRQDLAAKAKQAEVARWTLAQQADATLLAVRELNAAEEVLDGKELDQAFALPSMVTSKDSKAVAAFATDAVKAVLPCEVEGDQEHAGDYDRGPSCEPPPLEDNCLGVKERNAIAGKSGEFCAGT